MDTYNDHTFGEDNTGTESSMSAMMANNVPIKLHDSRIKFPIWGSPKLDGIRLIIRNGIMYIGRFKALHGNVHDFFRSILNFSKNEKITIDCILWSPHLTYPQMMEAVQNPQFRYKFVLYVCDLMENSEWLEGNEPPFIERFQNYLDWTWRRYGSREDIVPMDHLVIKSSDDLKNLYVRCLENGLQGCMIRAPDSRYHHGRVSHASNGMIQFLQKDKIDAKIVGFGQRTHLDARTRKEVTEPKLTVVVQTPDGYMMPSVDGPNKTMEKWGLTWDNRNKFMGKWLLINMQNMDHITTDNPAIIEQKSFTLADFRPEVTLKDLIGTL